MTPVRGARLRAVDWLRGGATLAMVQCHAMCLLRPELRAGALFKVVAWVDGFIAPAFFIAAGFSLALVQVRSGGAWRRAGRSAFRAGQVLAVQVALTSLWWNVWREPQWLLRIDVLSCIGLSLLLLLIPVTLLARQPVWLERGALVAAIALLLGTPALANLGGPLTPLLSTVSGSVFPLAPWGAHLVFGVALGARAARAPESLERAVWRTAGLALVLTGIAYALDGWLPPHDYFAQPWAHFERWAEVSAVLGVLLRIERRAAAENGVVRAIERLSRCSLSAYALHEVWLYTSTLGFCFHDAFGDRSSWAGYALETAALLGLTYLGCSIVEQAATLMRRVALGTRPTGR